MSGVGDCHEIFPDEPADSVLARYVVAVLPLVYLIVALAYSAYSAPWGRQVDPESTYAMSSLAWAAGFPMLKSDHPGTTTVLLGGLVVKLCAFLSGRQDVVEFGLKNYDAFIYASRAAEALILSGALLAAGIVVRNATRSWIAAALFQVAPFVNFEALHFEVMLTPESLMVSCAIFGMALVLKAALDRKPPTPGLGAAQGLVFGLGLSSKYLFAPLVLLDVAMFRNPRVCLSAVLVGLLTFFVFNSVLNPYVFTNGFLWLVSLATHKGNYGSGEPGFVDFGVFWPNMAAIISAGWIIFAVFVTGAFVALAQMRSSRRCWDPARLTLLASFLVFAVQLVATSKHFSLHYMLASWALAGGVLVLTVVEATRLWPAMPSRLIVAVAGLVGVVLISKTLIHTSSEAVKWIALNRIGARLSNAVVSTAPACANVSGMFVQAPENHLNHGAEMTLLTPPMLDRFSEAYARVFKVPLLDHSFYANRLTRNFLPYSYEQLAAGYPCIIVRTSQELNAKTSIGLFELKPDHCLIEDTHVYTVGIACEKIRSNYANESAPN
jgi:hypothetical protein